MEEPVRARTERLVSQSLLHRPAPGNALHRARLTEKLDRGLDTPLTVVSAPAGFGKTTLVSDWCDTIDRPVVWLSLDPRIDDAGAFLRHLVAAVRRVNPDALPHISDMATTPSLPTPESIGRELGVELGALPHPIVLVLDDYQNVADATVLRVVSALLDDPPTSVHVVILTRAEPALPATASINRGDPSALRMADLAFTAVEIGQIVDTELADLASAERLGDLARTSEGWPAGVRLGIEAIRHGTGARAAAGFFDRTAQEFLTTEVLDRVPPAVRRHLAVVSHFDMFSARLCDELARGSTGKASSMSGDEFIDWLGDHNLFLVPLDDQGIWFRFHQVFAALLGAWSESHGPPGVGAERDLHRIASVVYEQEGMALEAIQSSIRAEDGPNIARLAGDVGTTLADGGDTPSLTRLLSLIPTAVVDSDPTLLSLDAWAADMGRSQLRRSDDLVDRAESLLDRDHGTESERKGPTLGTLLLLRAHQAFVSGDMDAAAGLSRDAATLLESTAGKRRVVAAIQNVAALRAAGRVDAAVAAAEGFAADPRLAEAGWDPSASALVALAWRSCDLEQLERHASRLLDLGERFGRESNITDGRYCLGIAAYERHRLADAERHLTQLANRRFAAFGTVAAHGLIALTFTHLAAGRETQVDATMEVLQQHVVDTQSENLQPLAEAARAHIDLRRDNLAPALRWARRTALDPKRLEYMFFNPTATLVHALLTSPRDQDRGRRLLDSYLASAERQHHRPLTIRLLGLRAIDHRARGDAVAARSDARRAVEMAREGGAIRLLADLGPDIAPLLGELADSAGGSAHAASILAATGVNAAPPDPRDTRRVEGAGHVALTVRELEVLTLLAERYSNREIAAALAIAPATVKKHTVTLYEKLNVNGRREAAEAARARGFIAN